MKLHAILIGLAMAATTGAGAVTRDDFHKTLAEAEQARALAASVGGEWRDVGKLLDKAKADAGAGKLDSAVELARTALEYSELGYRQAVEQQQDYLIPPQVR